MKKNAQAILEYTILLIIIIASLLVMRYYLRNTLSGKMREGADSIGQAEVYGPYNASTMITTDTLKNQ